MCGEVEAECSVQVPCDDFLKNLGGRAQQFSQCFVKGRKLLGDLFSFDLVALLDAFVDGGAHNLARHKQAFINSPKQRLTELSGLGQRMCLT